MAIYAEFKLALLESPYINVNSYIPNQHGWIYPVRSIPYQETQLRILQKYVDQRYEAICPKRIQMAKKTNKTSTQFDWNMVQIDLTEADKKLFTKWQMENVANLETMLDEHLSDGYKFSFNKGKKGDLYYVTMTQTDEEAKDGRSSLTSYAGTWIKALMLTIYKYRTFCKDGLEERVIDTSDHMG